MSVQDKTIQYNARQRNTTYTQMRPYKSIQDNGRQNNTI